ncbi:hypothetical protein ACVWWR_001620 [Bradyrhizobium sp. LM3.2]
MFKDGTSRHQTIRGAISIDETDQPRTVKGLRDDARNFLNSQAHPVQIVHDRKFVFGNEWKLEHALIEGATTSFARAPTLWNEGTPWKYPVDGPRECAKLNCQLHTSTRWNQTPPNPWAAFLLCAEYERQLGGGSPLSSLMAAKD